MTFSQWIVKRTKQRYGVGDLAQDMLPDIERYGGCKAREDVMAIMDAISLEEGGTGASGAAVAALDLAWQQYEYEVPPRMRRAVSQRQRFGILKRDGYRCCLCGATAASGATLEVDHKVPVALGGSNDNSNLWALCFDCNRGKHAQSL